jgi:8-oxo-dGTP pyrophosphatase MutT (NUDIX family)
MQERDEFPVIDPEKWGFVGGHVEDGEDFETAAYRELEEETGIRLAPGTLSRWREFRLREEYVMQVWAAPSDLSDDDVECHEGRRIVFVDPAGVLDLDLGGSPEWIVPQFLDSATYARMTG